MKVYPENASEFGKIAITENTATAETTKIVSQDPTTGELNYLDAVNLPVSTAVNTALNGTVKKTGDDVKAGSLMANSFILPSQPLGSESYSFSGYMGTTDMFKIYGTDGGADKGMLVFKIGDNGSPFSGNGQKFSFRYDASSSGVAKTPFEIDYNDITANAIINANFNINSNANIISNGVIFTDVLYPNTGNNLVILNGGTNTLLVKGATTVQGTVTASPATTDSQLATLGQVKASGRPYKSCFLSLQLSASPTATTIDTQLGTASVSKTGTGLYIITLSENLLLNSSKTVVLCNKFTASSFTQANGTYLSPNSIAFKEYGSSGASEDTSNRWLVEIRVYN